MDTCFWGFSMACLQPRRAYLPCRPGPITLCCTRRTSRRCAPLRPKSTNRFGGDKTARSREGEIRGEGSPVSSGREGVGGRKENRTSKTKTFSPPTDFPPAGLWSMQSVFIYLGADIRGKACGLFCFLFQSSRRFVLTEVLSHPIHSRECVNHPLRCGEDAAEQARRNGSCLVSRQYHPRRAESACCLLFGGAQRQ